MLTINQILETVEPYCDSMTIRFLPDGTKLFRLYRDHALLGSFGCFDGESEGVNFVFMNVTFRSPVGMVLVRPCQTMEELRGFLSDPNLITPRKTK